MDRITRGWALVGASWQVLLREKSLLLFPVLSAICTLMAVAAFVLPAAVIFQTTRGGPRTDLWSDPGAIASLFVFYLITSFVTLFFNTALVGSVLAALRGGNPTVGTGFGIAMSHLPAILGYALISATVGVVLRLVEERFALVGRIVAALLGGAWSLLTFLVVPVMVAENLNPFDAIGRSKDLLRQTWGEQIAGNLGVSIVLFLFGLLGLIPLVLGFAVGHAALAVGIAVAIVYWGLLAVIGSALTQIFRVAVYVFASTGQVPAGFEGWMLREAFRAR